jgi:hypothetical protein
MKLFCQVKECTNFVEVNEAQVKEATTFTCRDHVPPGPENARFQNCQFDPDLDRGGEYVQDADVEEGDDTSDLPDPNILP